MSHLAVSPSHFQRRRKGSGWISLRLSYLYGFVYTLMDDMDLISHSVLVENSTSETNTQDTFLLEAETFMTYKVAKLLDNYWFPVLIPLGLVGNSLSFLVMIRPSNRKVSTCIYMVAISINDNAMMMWAFRSWYLYTFKRYYPEQCKLTVFTSLLILQNSTFQILAMTIDKYIAIKWPHKAATYSTSKRAKIMILSILTFVILYNLPHIFFTSVITGKCYAYSLKSILTKIHSWSSFVLNAVIPFTLLIHMNYVIVKTVRNSRKMFRTNNGTVGVERRDKTMKSAENQLTTMLLLVTTLFLILLLTTYIRFIYAAFVSSDTPSKFATSMLIFEISYNSYVTNSGINFFLYCVSGQKFRTDLKETVCGISRSCYVPMNSSGHSNSCSTIS